jgi:xylan 1,4-beta-xylosidase
MAMISINLAERIGSIKPLHGVNGGPVSYGSLLDVSDYFREAGIPFVRLHDTNWPHPREVDIPTIFPDMGKDAEDPASYDFRRTDEYIRTVADTGARIVYRLGVSIEHTKMKYFTQPPVDFGQWAMVCLGIIRHYNDGWAEGFRYGIRYWEIWNEPDNLDAGCMWSGTPGQYFSLYEKAAVAIKKYDPGLKVGGFGATMANDGFTIRFLDYCRSRFLPLDFFSWHTYADDPEKLAANARAVRRRLDEYGYGSAESHLNEWNYLRIEPDEQQNMGLPGNGRAIRRVFERVKGGQGAAFAAAALILFQDCGVDEACYYDAQPMGLYCGLFDSYGLPQAAYRAFGSFHDLCRHGIRLKAEAADGADGIYCCAGLNESGDEAAILIANFNSGNRRYFLCLDNLPPGNHRCEESIRDKDGTVTITLDDLAGGSFVLEKNIGMYSFTLFTLKMGR